MSKEHTSPSQAAEPAGTSPHPTVFTPQMPGQAVVTQPGGGIQGAGWEVASTWAHACCIWLSLGCENRDT